MCIWCSQTPAQRDVQRRADSGCVQISVTPARDARVCPCMSSTCQLCIQRLHPGTICGFVTMIKPARNRQRDMTRTTRRLQLWALCTCAVCAVTCALSTQDVTDPFIGWQGESYNPPLGSGKQMRARGGRSRLPPWVELVSWKPRVFVHHNFLTEEECEHMKRLAAPTMKRSTVVGHDGKSVLDDYRTSYGTFILRRADDVIASINKRLAEWTKIPEVHGEDIQVLRYGLGQQYKPHMDTLSDPVAGIRVATVLMYLNDVEEGGETAFPNSTHWANPELPKRMGPFSHCTNGGVAFKPRKGDALLFFSVQPDGSTEDMAAMHTGCPVLKGVKWSATSWIHAKPFRAETFGRVDPPAPDPGLCTDNDPGCEKWAKAGECVSNNGFMVGDGEALGACRLSCGACTACKAGDIACYNAQRAKLGYLEYDPAELGPGLVHWPSTGALEGSVTGVRPVTV